MKNLFRFKLELFVLITSTLSTMLSYSIYLTCNNDWRVKALMYVSGTLLLASIICFNTIKKFRHDVLKRW